MALRPSRPWRLSAPLFVCLFAAAIRLAVAASLWNLPLVRTPKLDSAEYLAWAQRLAAGDWTWPVVAQHGPGYPIFLAALLVLGTGSLKLAVAAQAIVGGLTAAVVSLIAARWAGSRAGLLAGIVYACYGPAVYFETAILSEGLLLFLLALGLWAIAAPDPTTRKGVLAGAAFGAAALVRPTALVIAVACTAAAAIAWHRDRVGAIWRRVAIVGAACLTILVPVLAKTWSTSRSLSIQGYGGLNAYIGNSPLHDGRPTFRLGAGWDALNSEAPRSGIADAAAQDRYYLEKVAREIGAEPAAFARLLASKLVWTFQDEEVRDSHSYYFFTQQSPPLRLLPRWSLLLPLAAIGFTVVARTSGRGLLLAYVIASAATVVLLVVGSRYRMPLVLGLTIAAGAGVDAVIGLVMERRTRDIAMAAAAATLAVAVSYAVSDPRNTNVAEEWAFTGSSLITEHKLDEAEAAYRRALQLDPQSGLAWDGFGLTLLNMGRLSEARSAFERAVAADRDSARALYHLAIVDEREGRLSHSAEGYERARELSPFDAEITGHLAEARRKLATELGMSGKTREARDTMRTVVELSPQNGDAWLDLCLLSLDLRDVDGASAAFQRARTLGADPVRLQFANEALTRASR